MRIRRMWVPLLALPFLATTMTSAQTNNGAPTKSRSSSSPEEILAYWTPERMANAMPESMPVVSSDVIRANQGSLESIPLPQGVPISVPAQILGAGDAPMLGEGVGSPDPATPQPRNVGTNGLHFTSTRLIPQMAVVEIPYRAAGKLYFTTPAGNATCTASVIRLRVVVTAGHCLNDGNGTFYGNFMFVPAQLAGVGPVAGNCPLGVICPFGRWAANAVFISDPWANGGGALPNAADYGVLVITDQNIGRGV